MGYFGSDCWATGRGGRHFAHRFGFGGGRGGRGFLGGDVPGGRKLSSSDLQLVLLALLDKQPAHGYELIKSLEERSSGFYSPSPGVIYPALTFLEEIGRAAVEPDGNRKRYRLTDEGREYLNTHRDSAEAMLSALGRIGDRMQDVRDAFAGLHDMDPKAADELHRARNALKHALLHARGCSHDEAMRIAEILERAAGEIRRVYSGGS